MIKLHCLYSSPHAWWLPYQLLHEREAHQNISHKTMPTWSEHCEFIERRPHHEWYWFESDELPVGCVYLSRQQEIGVGVLKHYHRRGLATAALRALMVLHQGERLLANINPANEASIALFRSLGFGGPIQITMEYP